jgi:hypothetical protein
MLDANRESFRFLGFEIGMKVSPRTGGSFPHVESSRKALQKLRDAVRNETAYYQRWRSCTETVTRSVGDLARCGRDLGGSGRCFQSHRLSNKSHLTGIAGTVGNSQGHEIS